MFFSLRWQVVEAGRFTEAAQGRIADTKIPSIRGAIYAQDGSTLAYSEPRWEVYVWIPELVFAERKELQTRDEFAAKVAPLIDMSPERLKEILTESEANGYLYPKVADSITMEERDLIQGLLRDKDAEFAQGVKAKLTGIDLRFTSQRIYPEGRLASQILGLTNLLESGDVIGQSGIEGEWDGFLEPQVGFIQGERDAVGNAISLASEKTIEAKRGSSIYTSVDKKLQEIVEEKLEWAVDKYGAKSGSVIIMDPKTGYISALANFPDYDPNLREEKDPNVYGDKAVSEPYEIGSIGKIMTIAAAIDAEIVTPESVILKEGHEGCEKIHKDLQPVCTHDKLPQPPLPINEAFALSDNIYFLHLADNIEKAHPGMFYEYLTKFGIGKHSGVDLAGESFGLLKDWQLWNIGDIAAYSYGHSFQANAVQAISMVAAVANYGVRMQPKIVTKIVESDGEVVNFAPVAVEQVIKPTTTAQMDEMMHVIYENNIFPWEHEYDDLRDYKIAMKSGTALIATSTGYSYDINATYVGYDASPDRSFVMLTRLEAPTEGDLASHNSRVLWMEIFDDVRDHLGVRRIGGF